MITTIDSAGRVVVPKKLRELLGLSGGEALEIREHDGVIELEPAPTPMQLEEHSGVLVAVPSQELPKLSTDEVRKVLERTRR